MLKRIKNLALLAVLSGVLTGFVVEQVNVFQHADSICLKETDGEKKDNGSKKFGHEDKFHPEEWPVHPPGLSLKTQLRRALHLKSDMLLSGDYVSIVTPPPERA